MDKNYYDVLGVKKDATKDEIKKAFRNLSKKWHPDLHTKDSEEDKAKAEERFKEINEAYSVLSDPDKKDKYDKYGTINEQEIRDQQAASGWGSFFDDNPFGGNPFEQERVPVEVGADMKITMSIPFADLYKGIKKKIKVNRGCKCERCHGSGSTNGVADKCEHCKGTGVITDVKYTPYGYTKYQRGCPHCNGTGISIKDPCPRCNGTGVETKNVDMEFEIPAGIQNDTYIKLPGKGHAGPHNGMPGDFFVHVTEKPDERGLKRDAENNILYRIYLDYPDMVFGCDKDIPLPEGTKNVHIPPGTPSGKVITFYGLGFPICQGVFRSDGKTKGDYLLSVVCRVPSMSTLTEEQRKMLLDYQKTLINKETKT